MHTKFMKKVREMGILVRNRWDPHAHIVRTNENIASVIENVQFNPKASTLDRDSKSTILV